MWRPSYGLIIRRQPPVAPEGPRAVSEGDGSKLWSSSFPLYWVLPRYGSSMKDQEVMEALAVLVYNLLNFDINRYQGPPISSVELQGAWNTSNMKCSNRWAGAKELIHDLRKAESDYARYASQI